MSRATAAIIWSFPCHNMAELESAFRRVFDRYRILGGEWFDFQPIDDPEILAIFLELLGSKHFAESLPLALQARLEVLEAFIDSPEKFLSSQRGAESILANRFPDLDKYADDPAALEAYIEQNLSGADHRRSGG